MYPHIRRSVRFTLHFDPAPKQMTVACLSKYAEPVEDLELLCDGKLLHRYFRNFGSVTREYLCDTAAHRFALRTCGTIRMESYAELPEGDDNCHLQAAESDAFRLTLAEMNAAPADIDIMKYNTTYAAAEDLVDALLDWTTVLEKDDCLLISFDESRYSVSYQTDDTLHCDDSREGYRAEYASLHTEHPDFQFYDRLSVRNRKHLQRYVFGYLRGHEELKRLHFHWHDTYIRVTAAQHHSADHTLLTKSNDL